MEQVDLSGKIIQDSQPVAKPSHGQKREHSFAKEKRPKQTQCYKDGERTKYFADDDNTSLTDLVKDAKTSRYSKGIDDNFAENLVKRGTKYTGQNVDDEYDHDGGMRDYEDRRTRMSQQKREQKQRESAIN